MEGLSEPLLAEIIKRITRTSDLNSLSLVSKQLYNAEAEERGYPCWLQSSPCNRNLVLTVLPVSQLAESRDQLLWLDVQTRETVGQPRDSCAFVTVPFADGSHPKLLLLR